MYNISFIDFGVTDEPLEVNETWTKTMYICLFVGQFWCGTVTFIMLLAIHTHCEQLRTRQRHGPVATTLPFWADWQSSIASRLTRRDWAVTTDDEAASSSAVSEDYLYEEVALPVSDVEDNESMDRERDALAIHFWRPFEDHPLLKTCSRYESGECLEIYCKDPEGSRSRGNRCDLS